MGIPYGVFCVFEWLPESVEGLHWKFLVAVRQETNYTSEYQPLLKKYTHTLQELGNAYDWVPINGRLVVHWTLEKGQILESWRPPEKCEWMGSWAVASLGYKFGSWRDVLMQSGWIERTVTERVRRELQR